jgi:ribokinase
MSHIVVVGSLNMDLVVRTPHMPIPGETVLGRDFRTIPGGKGANQAVGAARLGAQVSMVGRVGADGFGETLRANLQANGIDTTHVLTDTKAPSGVALITLDATGQNTIVVASGTNMCLTPADVCAAFTQTGKVDVVVLQLESPLECVLEAARQGKARGAKIVLNPAPAQPLSDALLALVDVLVPNESEAALLSGQHVDTPEQAENAARQLFARGVGAVVLTLGSRGALLVSPSAPGIHFPPYNVQVIDTTAAGDAFVAALSVGIADELPLEKAVQQANAAGALAVTKMGAQPSMPTKKEVDELITYKGI